MGTAALRDFRVRCFQPLSHLSAERRPDTEAAEDLQRRTALVGAVGLRFIGRRNAPGAVSP